MHHPSIVPGGLQTARALVLVWAGGVAFEYRALAYPHAAYLFHLHTVVATLFVVCIVFATAAALDGRTWAGRYQRKENPKRFAKLRSHRKQMFVVVCLSATAASLMVYKKQAAGRGLLIVSGRSPSWHSLAAIGWTLLEVSLVASGALIYINKNAHDPPAPLKAIATGAFGSLGEARKRVKPLHRIFGCIACTLAMGVAALGLTEYGSLSANPLRFALAALLIGIWTIIWAADIFSRLIAVIPGLT